MMELKPNSVTHLSCLITGDRFYFTNDSKKQVWELRYQTLVKWRGQFKRFSQCRSDTGDVRRFDANRMVTFLRRTYKPPVKSTEFDIAKFFA